MKYSREICLPNKMCNTGLWSNRTPLILNYPPHMKLEVWRVGV